MTHLDSPGLPQRWLVVRKVLMTLAVLIPFPIMFLLALGVRFNVPRVWTHWLEVAFWTGIGLVSSMAALDGVFNRKLFWNPERPLRSFLMALSCGYFALLAFLIAWKI